MYKPAFQNLQAMRASGKTLTTDELRSSLKVGSLVLVSPDESSIEAFRPRNNAAAQPLF